MWLFALNHQKKYILRQRHARFTMISSTYGCLVVVVDCWPFTREISDNRKRKCLQIPDYYRKFSYDTHTTIAYIFTMFRVTESAFTRNLQTYEKTCDVVTFTIIINLWYLKIVSTDDPSRYPPLGWVSRSVVSACCDIVNASYLPTTTTIYDLDIR